MTKRVTTLSPLSQTAPPQEYNLSLNLESENFGEPRTQRLLRLQKRIEESMSIQVPPKLPQNRINQLYRKIGKGMPYSIGVEVTPSSMEKECEKWLENIDRKKVEVKSLVGEIFHYFNFLVVYNTILYLLRGKFNLAERETVDQFFGEFKRGRYIPKDDSGILDITFYSKLIAQKKYSDVKEIHPEKQRILDFDLLDYSDHIFNLYRNYNGIGQEVSLQIVRLSLKDLIYYMNHIEIDEDQFRAEVLNKLSRDLYRFISYGYRLFGIIANLQNVVVKPIGNEKGEMSLGIMTEQSVILNCEPIESLFFPRAIEFDLNRRKNPQEFISLCRQKFGIYSIYNAGSNTIEVTIPPKLNPQFKCKFDLILFQQRDNGDLRAEILDHKSSIKDIESESVKMNAFIQRLVAGALLYIKKVHSKDHSPIILGPVDLFDEELRDLVLNETRFFLFSPEQENPREVLKDLDEFTYSEYLFRIIGFCERKALESEFES